MHGCEGSVNYETRQAAGRGEQEAEVMRRRG